MKKNKLAMLTLAAVMTLGCASITTMAAQGWVYENSAWVYYNSSGYKVYNEWQAGADGYYRYIGSNGTMSTNAWVDNDNYYVDSNGIMIYSTWLQVPNDYSDSGYTWYYFNSTGKAIKNQWYEIDSKWYNFDDSGEMQTGWLEDGMYYSGSDGAMRTGWQYLYPEDYDEDDYAYYYYPFEEEEDGKNWYYFSSNGKKVVPDTDDDEIKQKLIGGVYYCLDETGAMMTGWVCITGDESDDITDYRYVDDSGQIRTGWYSVEPPEDLSGEYVYEVEWFYFSSKGVPKAGVDWDEAETSNLSTLNGYTYLFNDYGTPAFGMKKVYYGDDDEYYTYYFGTRAESSMQTGKMTLIDNGVSTTYYFSSTGRGYTGVYDGYLYYKGKIQKADSGSKYDVISMPDGNGYNNYVVSTTGKVMKNADVKDSAGNEYETGSTGILILENDDDDVYGHYTSPEEPDWYAYDYY